MWIELERPADVAAIHRLTLAAFDDVPYSDQTEARIVDALRDAGALTLSLVAWREEEIIGHAAFSPVRVNGQDVGLFGLGPVSVRAEHQRSGVGSAIVHDGLDRLKAKGATGCVVFGDPGYYGRFGFVSDPQLRYPPAPDGYFQRVLFTQHAPVGEVAYHPGFDVA